MQVRVGLFAIVLFAALAIASASAFGAAAPAGGDAEWNKTVAAAKKEGKIVIIGPSGSDVRDAYTIGFQKKYPEIEVDFSGMRGAEVAPKLLAELNAKQYLTDIAVAGTTTALASLVPANAVVPLQPYLVGPEAKDVSKWRDRKHHFSDSTEKYNLYFGARVQVAFVYNTELNPPATMKSKIKTWQDLLNPEWKGKIAVLDPRQAGAGLDLSTYWYTNEKQGLGKEFIRKLFTTQEVFISREEQQILDFVARGRHSIAIGPSGTLTFQLISRGLPLALFGSGAMQSDGFVTASNGTMTVVRNAPHQNAIKVYIDYLLSREGQISWSKASGLASLRTDVPKDHIPEVLVPDEGVKYQETHLEKYVMMRKEIVDFLNTVIRR
ncbi:MAG TPA: extracellular solute-binding protein [Candidatus Binatia bacterium]|nr:extracellular solute-binding protein [Candidatus Binatia bacterium]